MGIHTEEAKAVIDEYGSPVNSQLICKHDHTAVGSRHRRTFGRSQIGTQMDLAIDLLALIGIRAMVGETRSRC